MAIAAVRFVVRLFFYPFEVVNHRCEIADMKLRKNRENRNNDIVIFKVKPASKINWATNVNFLNLNFSIKFCG